jgi:hypothetical protein
VNSASEIERTSIKKSHGSQREQWQALCKMPCGLTANEMKLSLPNFEYQANEMKLSIPLYTGKILNY